MAYMFITTSEDLKIQYKTQVRFLLENSPKSIWKLRIDQSLPSYSFIY